MGSDAEKHNSDAAEADAAKLAKRCREEWEPDVLAVWRGMCSSRLNSAALIPIKILLNWLEHFIECLRMFGECPGMQGEVRANFGNV